MGGSSRMWWQRAGLWFVRRHFGFVPGPIQVLTYRPEFFPPPMRNYMLRSTSGRGCWSYGETEVMASYVSRLNACSF